LTIVSVCWAGSAAWEGICGITRRNHATYAQRHGYGLRCFTTRPATDRSPQWFKVPALMSVLTTPNVTLVFWTDGDSLFMDMRVPLDRFAPRTGKFMSASADRVDPANGFLNTGHFMLRNDDTGLALELLREVWDVYPPPYPATLYFEQGSFVYVLGGSRPHCRLAVNSRFGEHDGGKFHPPICSTSRGVCSRDPRGCRCAFYGDDGLPDPCMDLSRAVGRYADGFDSRNKTEMNAWPSDFELGRDLVVHTAGMSSAEKQRILEQLSRLVIL